jgi:hypothetical protein
MATLNHDEEAWWRYAIEFARRGLWPLDEIETHGPHEAPGDRIWGTAFCVADDRSAWEVNFAGPTGCRHYSDIRGLRMQAEEDETLRFPVLPSSERNQRVRAWLSYAMKRARGE